MTRTRVGRLATAAVTLGALAAASTVAAALRRRQEAVSRVLPELRHPVLYAPMSLRDQRSLEIGRRMLSSVSTPVADDVDMTERTVPGPGGDVRVLVYEATDRPRPGGAVIWLHGGGTVMGTPEGANAFCSTLAARAGVLVVNVDYRLAPEHPFPAGLDDCAAALRWVSDAAEDLGVDTTRIAVGGDSAGGGLAAALAQRAHDEGGPPIAFQALVYPMLDDRTTLRDDPYSRGEFVWTPTSNRFAWSAYLGHPPRDEDDRPYASAARREDLSGLPPAWIGVGDLDLFHDEDLDYAARLERAGVECSIRIETGTYHGADQIAPTAPTSQAFRGALVEALADAVGASTTADAG